MERTDHGELYGSNIKSQETLQLPTSLKILDELLRIVVEYLVISRVVGDLFQLAQGQLFEHRLRPTAQIFWI